MEQANGEERIAALERENRIIKKKLERSEANRALVEEALASHIEVIRVRYAEAEESRDEYCELSAKLRAEIEQEYLEKEKMNEKLFRLDRLNLIGEMAAIIGHEVRNPLTFVRGYLQFFEDKSVFGQYKENLGLMIEELDRANSIITEFLSLAKNKKTALRAGNLKNILLAIRPLLDVEAIQRGHELDLELQDTPDILMDENQIRQMVINLVRNGLEAMVKPGRMSIKTIVDGDTVVFSVKDSGIGIPAEIMEKIGTPFFTTKENGSGLGLTVTSRIAERHQALIQFASSPGETTVAICFPVSRRGGKI
ncbi:MAG: ATP-binding protein [Negativicutes bacterium]|nr:ATP-binding protein [Negativicutes bacterium]